MKCLPAAGQSLLDKRTALFWSVLFCFGSLYIDYDDTRVFLMLEKSMFSPCSICARAAPSPNAVSLHRRSRNRRYPSPRLALSGSGVGQLIQ